MEARRKGGARGILRTGRYQPGPKEILPTGNQQPHCGYIRANQPFTALFQQAYLGVGFTASHRHQTITQWLKRRAGQGPPERRWGCYGIREETSLNGVTSACPRGRVPRPHAGGSPRGRRAGKELPPRSLRGVGHVATPSAMELQQVEPGGVRNE